MRLTLRTLLAYRDNVLSPADREDLHRRIQSSPYGGNLLRGIGEITQRNVVAAPPVVGSGLAADANSIAEYLDDALPHSQVAEFERICLDSAVHLAELADCHSLLSSAVHTKVSVSSELRRMALGLGDPTQRTAIKDELNLRRQSRRRSKLAVASAATDGAAEAARQDISAAAPSGDSRSSDMPVHVEVPMLASGGESIRPQGLNLETSELTNGVPAYLMGTASGQWKFPLAIGGLMALLIILVWRSLGPLENVREMFANVPAQSPASSPAVQPVDLDTIVEADQVPPGVAAIKADESPAPESAAEIATEDGAPPSADPSRNPSPLPAAELDGSVAVETEMAAPPGLARPEMPPKPDQATPSMDSNLDDAAGSMAAPPGVASAAAAADVAAELKAFSDQEAPHDAANSNDLSDSHAVWQPSGDEANQAVILWREADVWQRVQATTPLRVDSQWVIPPATRAVIDLPGGIHWTACGPSQMVLAHIAGSTTAPANQSEHEPNRQPSGSGDISLNVGIATPLCRALVRGGPDGRDLRLSTPVGNFQIQWNNPNSLVSIEVAYRPVAAGAIVDRQATKPILIIVAADESVTVTPLGDGGTTHQLNLGDGLAFVLASKPTTFRLQNIPDWYRSSADRPIDIMAASDLDRFTQPKAAAELDATNKSAGVLTQLVELSHSRRPETAALAVQTALLCGDWKPLAAGFLDDARMRIHWMPTIRLAQQVLAANPTAEADVRTVFNEAYGESGTEIVDLLRGLAVDTADPAALATVIQQLESPQLAVRVLALYQLQNLTGKTLGVQPAVVSRNAVQQWRRELATNRDLSLPIGDPIWERIPR